MRQMHRAEAFRQILLMKRFHLLQMPAQRFVQRLRKHRHPILAAFAVTHGDPAVTEIDILDPQT